MLVENLSRRISCATTLAGAVLLVAAGPASATVLGGSSDQGPAMVQFGSQLCAAWSGTDSSHHLNIACGDPTVGNFQTVTTNQLSAFAPALAVYDNTVWMAWTGTNNVLNIAAVDANPGSLTATPEAFTVGNNDASSQAPALAVAEVNGVQQLVIAWTGTDSSHHLNIASSVNVDPPSTWSSTITLGQLASGGPSLAAWNGNLYIGWAGTDSNHSLNFAMATANTLSFGGAQQVRSGSTVLGSSNGPSLTTTANLNYGWRGSGNDIFIAFYNNTTPPAVPATVGNSGIATGFSPALFTFNGALWIGWIDGNNNLQAQLL